MNSCDNSFFFKRSLTNCISFLFSLFQLHHSSSPPSTLLCRSTTDIPRDATSTSLPLCRLFTCKSLKLFALPKKYRPIAPENTFRYESGSPKTSFRPWAWSILLVGAGLLSLPLRIKGRGPLREQHDPHVRDTQMNMCQRHGNESGAKGGSLGACDSHKSSDQALSRGGSNSSVDVSDRHRWAPDTPTYTTNRHASANHVHARAIGYEVQLKKKNMVSCFVTEYL